MPQLEEKKLEKFTSAVLRDAQEQREHVLTEIDEYRKAQLQQAEENILHEAYVMIQNEIAAVKNAHGREISLAELERRRSLLLLRETLTDKVFEEAAQKVADFSQTPEYIALVGEQLKECAAGMPDGDTVLRVKPDDLKSADAFLAAYGKPAVCEADPGIRLGGVLVFNRAHGVISNLTLDLRLQGERDWFAASSGLSIG